MNRLLRSNAGLVRRVEEEILGAHVARNGADCEIVVRQMLRFVGEDLQPD